ncbi:LytTR family DNA-binding domain-containing protein [Roseovarius salinarum]|uniref:LytTR family DNA-binding domain-containing protein n=1 Tax=Roseovarius salinarum TaxID=1981892 RepID=UPI000C33FCE6|nr:LytTR family DNA-binding domain-containing protein [Roseovarius salinarum]
MQISLWKRIRASLSDTFQTILSPLTVFFWGILIVIAVLAQPFGTDWLMAPVARVAYWAIIVTSGILLGYAVRSVTAALVSQTRPLLFDVTAIVMMTTVFTPWAWICKRLFMLPGLEQGGGIWRTLLHVAVLSLAVFVGRRLIPGLEPGSYLNPVAASDTPREPRLHRRLRHESRGPVLRLAADGHFVEVVTEAGTDRLRMRLADAIEEMEPVDGLRTHRSHWVAVSAVVALEHDDNGRPTAVLHNGDRVPVSRRYHAQVTEIAGSG